MQIHMYIHVYTHTNCTHTCTHIHTHIYTHAHTHVHTHAHVQECDLFSTRIQVYGTNDFNLATSDDPTCVQRGGQVTMTTKRNRRGRRADLEINILL